jgi:AcrR family transcriptional regulator
MLVEGLIELPVAEVAERSGVNRGTVYRWWPTPADLLIDATALHWNHRLEPPDTGAWAGDVRAVIFMYAALVDEPVERAIMIAMTTGRYPAFTDLIMDVWRQIAPQWFGMIGRAVGRGEVSAEIDPAMLLHMMLAPAVSVSLFEGRALSSDEIESLVTLICRATLETAGTSAGAASPKKAGAASPKQTSARATATKPKKTASGATKRRRTAKA